MLNSYLKRSFRSLLKNRLFSLINIGGLASGISMAMLLFLYMNYERNFDSFQSNKDRIFRLISHSTLDDMPEAWGCSPNIAGPTFKTEIPGIREQVRLIRHNFGEPANVKMNGHVFMEDGLFWTDQSVTSVFDFAFVKGNAPTALSKPHSMAISESTAKKYFGEKDPLGENIKIDNSIECEITGVFKDLPAQSSIQPAMMGSMSSIAWMVQNMVWSNASFETYFLLQEGTDYKEVEKQISRVSKEKKPASAGWITFSLQPFSELHLGSADIQNTYVENTGSLESVRIVGILVFVILLIASINYMNLATARSQKRFREVGICKTLGAGRGELMRNFYIETALMVILAFILSLLILTIALPYFNTITHSKLQLQQLWNVDIAASVLLSLFVIILISGLYPALYLSSFSPKDLFRVSFRGDKFNGALRYALVVIQFSVSIVLIFSTIVFYRQLKFVQNTNLGFRPEQVLCLSISGVETKEQMSGLINEMNSISGITGVCRAQAYPGKDGSSRTLFKSNDPEHYKNIITCRSTPEIVSVLGLKMLAGRPLKNGLGDLDSNFQVVLNRTAVEFLGYTPEEAIGKRVNVISNRDEITGVVEDFHYQSLHEPIGAYAFHNAPTENQPYMLVRMDAENSEKRLEQIRQVFSKNLPNAAFDHIYLEGYLRNLYSRESQTVAITFLFSGLAIVLACLGLFGLSAYMIELRVKEIGVRKVLGASVTNIVFLISRKFVFQVLLSGAIALPLSWLLMTYWLGNFAFHIKLSWSMAMVTLSIVLFTALLTISFQSVKAATTKPAKNLRTE